jgi:hypothetical protein
VPADLARRDDGPATEVELVLDLFRRAAWIGPALVLVSTLIWGLDGAASSAFSMAVVLLNFLAAALVIAWAARISLTLLWASVLGGYIVRLGLVLLALFLVKDASWVSRPALFGTLLIAHLGLLVWETRYLSLSLAYPALKPSAKEARNSRGLASRSGPASPSSAKEARPS